MRPFSLHSGMGLMESLLMTLSAVADAHVALNPEKCRKDIQGERGHGVFLACHKVPIRSQWIILLTLTSLHVSMM